MHDGKALQSATSHFFGNGFPDAYDIKYLDKNNELSSVYETSMGTVYEELSVLLSWFMEMTAVLFFRQGLLRSRCV